MRTRLRFACCLLALLAMFPAGSVAQGPDAIDAPRISQSAFKKLIAAKNVLIVDTRNAESYAEGHIAGALLLPLEGVMTWPDSYEKTVLPKLIASRRPVVTYCA